MSLSRHAIDTDAPLLQGSQRHPETVTVRWTSARIHGKRTRSYTLASVVIHDSVVIF